MTNKSPIRNYSTPPQQRRAGGRTGHRTSHRTRRRITYHRTTQRHTLRNGLLAGLGLGFGVALMLVLALAPPNWTDTVQPTTDTLQDTVAEVTEPIVVSEVEPTPEPVQDPIPEPEPHQSRTELIEETIHVIVNQHRDAAGLAPLERDSRLDTIARAHSQDMADRDYYSHDTPEGLDPTDRGMAAGYDCRKDYGSYYTYGIAENIHSTYSDWYGDPVQMGRLLMDGLGDQMGWMDSYGHRQNIMDPNYDHIGVGVAFNDAGDVYATQNFC